jgi:hypothetical protein
MKTLVLTLAVTSLFACKTTKEVVKTEESPMQEESATIRTLGTVHLQSQGCDVVVEVEENGVKKTFFPFGIEEKFKVEGLRLKFVYTLSRAPQPKDCKCDHVVVLSDVSAVR